MILGWDASCFSWKGGLSMPTLRQVGGCARGTGFLARFLLAWPESTQGQRLFVEAPTDWPRLSALRQGVAELLEQAAPIDEHGALSPVVLSLDLEAKRVWVRFHDVIERQLCTGGELAEVRDVASKAADNAARLAALFHAVELGPGGAVGPKTLENAARIVAWHVNEARRVLGDLVLSPDLTDAERLDGWLVHYCRHKGVQVVSRRELQRNVTPPVHLRKGTSLDEALKALEECIGCASEHRSAEGHSDQPGPAPGGAEVTLTIRLRQRGQGTGLAATFATVATLPRSRPATVATVAVAACVTGLHT